ncbi:MAG: hypothetical protein JWN11_961 [Hyphomicrobiales bacterium]|nr:hypothetical protein [Hyphomicrobiales bacterium]
MHALTASAATSRALPRAAWPGMFDRGKIGCDARSLAQVPRRGALRSQRNELVATKAWLPVPANTGQFFAQRPKPIGQERICRPWADTGFAGIPDGRQFCNVAILAIDATPAHQLRAGGTPNAGRGALPHRLQVAFGIDAKCAVSIVRIKGLDFRVREAAGEIGENGAGMKREGADTVRFATAVQPECEQGIGSLRLPIGCL